MHSLANKTTSIADRLDLIIKQIKQIHHYAKQRDEIVQQTYIDAYLQYFYRCRQIIPNKNITVQYKLATRRVITLFN